MSYSILVIDDNDDIRENIVEILQLAGYKADAASNGKSGVALALKQKPDLIVCDIMMPELDGYGVIHLLRTNPETQRTPVIFLTAKSERSDFRKGMELGADDYITKPFDDLELLKAVETRLKRVEFAAKNHKGVSNFFEELNAVSAGLPGSGLIEADSYEKKQVLYSENKTPRFLYYVNSGKVKTFRSHPDGKEYITNLYVSGDFIGYTSLIEDKFYDETAQVMEDAELLRISKENFLKLLYNDPLIAQKFIQLISNNVRDKEERLVNLAYSSLRKRVANGLLIISSKISRGSANLILEISREEIAQFVGTATESLIRTLSDFKSEGAIEIKAGKILMTNPSKLHKIADNG